MTDSRKTREELLSEAPVHERRIAGLEESLRRLNDAYQIAAIGVWERDLAAGKTVWSDGVYRVFGYEPGGVEVQADTFLETMHPDDRPRVAAAMEDVIRSKGPFAEVDYRVSLPDGAERIVHSKADIRYGADGRAIRMIGTVQDVTEAKRAEERLRQSEEKFRHLMENNPVGIAVTNEDGDCMEANPAIVRLFGYASKAEFAAVPAYEHYHDIEERRKLYDALKRDGGVKDFRVLARRKDGSVFPGSLTSVFQSSKDGKVELLSMFEDVTERRRHEEELKTTAELLREAQRIAQMGSWEWNILTNRITWSDEVYRMFGYEPAEFEVTYDAFLKAVHPDDRAFVTRAVDEAVGGKKPYSIDHRIVLPDGEERIVHERGVVNYDGGRPARMVGTVQDVTERKHIEDELLRAQKLESIGELAGGIAHDFNNLLLGIVGNVSLAKNLVSPGDKIYKLLTNVENTAMRTKDLTRQLLTFSRGGEPVREAAPMEQLIKDCAGLVMRDSNVKCRFDLPKDLHHVEMDEGQIAQAFNNIILNARHAMAAEPGGAIEISGRNARVLDSDHLPMPEGDYVKITVKDSGPGIPRKIIHRVFDPFFTTKDRASGLGLAISYSIIKKHNGHISVESKEGSGAWFHVYLPASPRKASAAQAEEAPVRGSGRVLVMDDEEVVRDVSGEMLKLLGYCAEFAVDGREAIELYRRASESGNPYAAIIMDLSIPGGVGGKEAITKLLEIDPGVKAIVSSGYSKDPIMSDFRKYGFSAVIAKPYRVAEFSRVVKTVVAGKA
ncbi:MAG: PAS domain-containing protein [Deltaproteobacteria bacterium]|nr:PAS domain-containing protein [Deltaproteobacteria bacterium]